MLAGGRKAAERPLIVLVGSSNPVKIAAVAAAVRACGLAPATRPLEVRGVPSLSGVSDQPVGDDETLRGAVNRVLHMQASHQPCSGSSGGGVGGGVGGGGGVESESGAGGPHLLVAIEGGVLWRPAGYGNPGGGGGSGSGSHQGVGELYCMAWCAAKSPLSGTISKARSAEFQLPPALAALVNEGLELGAADDKVFGRMQSGQGTGTIGKLTNGLITREQYYTHAVQMALVPFLNPELYPGVAGPLEP
ncbi:NTPase [Monoraphidium neglectum]|uniref:inosine/xanthosine triphosphatase n=1 Tax=Monoraphidium neglectum TaxID=145388 RepID=A0A0D2MNM0_9CHLO|nr:NTPase [Monoraphidium neglectum]KIY96300.1 NTPase [Monoraphidium neglectum]|eukprot:XP_013895320.1 NTPase [Monoraphidium neglectum]